MRALAACFILLVCAPVTPLAAAEPVDLNAITRIRDEGFRRSQVMDLAAELTDGIGARVTGSPALLRAGHWSRDKLAEWGLVDTRLEPYDFGRGWSWSRCSLDLLGESARSLSAIPQGWTPGTPGPVEGEAVRLKAEKAEELEALKGTLQGKFVFLDGARPVEPRDTPPFKRRTAEDLTRVVQFDPPDGDDGPSPWLERYRTRLVFRRALDAFLAEEGALGIVEISSRDHGILRVPRGGEPVDPEPLRIPAVTLMAEQYNRLVRLMEKDRPVRLRLEVEAAFHDQEGQAFNTVAEWPGTDRSRELVIVGAHLDSYQAGTGATDNAAGVSVVMEAVRILKAIGVQPRRTIRVCLWSGEEQGLLGSKAYVAEHFAGRPAWTDPDQLALPVSLREETGPLTYTPEHARVSAYFNLDNGGGKIRGIYLEENAALRPIFEAWLAPLEDLGAGTVTLNRTGGTDHRSFDAVGIPGFQFIQDSLDYMPQTHHTHLDTYDHLQPDDLRQAAVVMATVILHAANRDQMLPRKPRPVERTPNKASDE